VRECTTPVNSADFEKMFPDVYKLYCDVKDYHELVELDQSIASGHEIMDNPIAPEALAFFRDAAISRFNGDSQSIKGVKSTPVEKPSDRIQLDAFSKEVDQNKKDAGVLESKGIKLSEMDDKELKETMKAIESEIEERKKSKSKKRVNEEEDEDEEEEDGDDDDDEEEEDEDEDNKKKNKKDVDENPLHHQPVDRNGRVNTGNKKVSESKFKAKKKSISEATGDLNNVNFVKNIIDVLGISISDIGLSGGNTGVGFRDDVYVEFSSRSKLASLYDIFDEYYPSIDLFPNSINLSLIISAGGVESWRRGAKGKGKERAVLIKNLMSDSYGVLNGISEIDASGKDVIVKCLPGKSKSVSKFLNNLGFSRYVKVGGDDVIVSNELFSKLFKGV
jgi:hypothetical protein